MTSKAPSDTQRWTTVAQIVLNNVNSSDTEDGTFDAMDFYDQIMKHFEDNEEWVQDTLN